MVSDVVVWVTDIIAFFGVDQGSGYSSCPPMGVQRNSLSKRMNINGSSLFLHSSELLQTGDMKRRPEGCSIKRVFVLDLVKVFVLDLNQV